MKCIDLRSGHIATKLTEFSYGERAHQISASCQRVYLSFLLSAFKPGLGPREAGLFKFLAYGWFAFIFDFELRREQ
jgi:hypothetical protein